MSFKSWFGEKEIHSADPAPIFVSPSSGAVESAKLLFHLKFNVVHSESYNFTKTLDISADNEEELAKAIAESYERYDEFFAWLKSGDPEDVFLIRDRESEERYPRITALKRGNIVFADLKGFRVSGESNRRIIRK